MRTQRSITSDRSLRLAVLFATCVFPPCACKRGDNPGFFTEPALPKEAPRPIAAAFVDLDGGGPGEDDVLLVTFDRPVLLRAQQPEGFIFEDEGDSLGAGAVLEQSVPASTLVEIVLGTEARLSPGTTGSKLNLARGSGVTAITGTDGTPAGPGDDFLSVADATTTAPRLVEARFADTDFDGTPDSGDRLVLIFDKPVTVLQGATAAGSFTLPVTGDSFGVGATVHAATSLLSNLGVVVVLGAGASIKIDGVFSSAATTAGSPSGIAVGPAAEIEDTATGGVVPAGDPADIAEAKPHRFGRMREAELILGQPDAATPQPNFQGVASPAALDFVSGTLTLEGFDFEVSLLFVADREHHRILVFADFPGGNFAAASWSVGGPFSPLETEDPALSLSPSGTDASSLRNPEGVAFDLERNRLYVADTGNHRLLVFEELFRIGAQSGRPEIPAAAAATFAWGQPDLAANRPNRGLGGPTASSLASPAAVRLGGGRLFVADRGNNRVLIFGSPPENPGALPSVVLGQADFSGHLPNRGGLAPAAATLSAPDDVFYAPELSVGGSAGALLVADTGNHRVLVYAGVPSVSGAGAAAVLGQADFTSGDPDRGGAAGAGTLDTPRGVAAFEDRIFVADTGNHRVLHYEAGAGIANGMDGEVFGQADAASTGANRGGAPGAGTLQAPRRVEVTDGALLVSDAGNHRILAYEGAGAPPEDPQDADLVFGQPDFAQAGRGGARLSRPSGLLLFSGRLFVADTANHRVLAYAPPPLEGDPDPALVLGQPDAFSTAANRGGAAAAGTLRLPTGLAGAGGRLAVADTGNHRILVWTAVPAADGADADLVLGQEDFASALPNRGGTTGRKTLSAPEGLAIAEGRLVVADRDNHRVLVFGELTALSGDDAPEIVLGQGDFVSSLPNRGGPPGASTLHTPRAVLFAGGRLYVADSGNHRVLVWNGVPSGNGEPADGVLGQADFTSRAAAAGGAAALLEPAGLALSLDGALLAVADTGHHRILFFDEPAGRLPRSRKAVEVLGQAGFEAALPNGGGEAPSRAGLRRPLALLYTAYELFAADAGNSRVAGYR